MMAGAAKKRFRFGLAIIQIFFLLTVCIPLNSNAQAEIGKTHLSIGFSGRAFVNAPKEDMRVAVRILSQKVARKTVGSAEARIYDSPTDMEHDLKAKKLDIVALTPEDFLVLAGRTPIDPVMISATEKGHEVEMLLLVRKDSRIRNLRELLNRTISMPAKVIQYGNMYFPWVETLIMREGFHDMAAFFASVRETPSPSQALMQVFFRRADACAVTSQVFELTAELNPQIGRELMVLARLDKLAGGIIAVRRDLPEELKQKIRQALQTLHEDQEGRQLFVLFQLSRLVPYRPEYMKATEALFAEHRNRERRIARKP